MALICPVCSVENREGANFCKNCGSTLSSASPRIPPPPGPSQAGREWAATAPAQLRAPTIPAPLFDIGEPPPPSRGFFGKAPAAADPQTVIVMPGQPPLPPAPPSSSSSRRERSERKRSGAPRPVEPADPPLRKRGLMLWLVLLAVAVVMVVAGWYGFGTRKAVEPAEAPPPAVAPAPPAPPPVAEPPPAAPAAPEAPETPFAVPAAEEAAATVAPAAPKAAPVAKPRKPVPAAPPAAAAESPAPAAAAVAPPPPAPAAPADPQALCADRNFIAKAQCMASQCLKPEFKPLAQCEAVRRQQRIEEEKRNPTLLN